MELGQVAFVFPLLDGRWCNCGVKQSASDRPPSNSLRAQAQHLPGTAIGAKVCRTWGFGAADLALRHSVCIHDQLPVRAGRKPHSGGDIPAFTFPEGPLNVVCPSQSRCQVRFIRSTERQH